MTRKKIIWTTEEIELLKKHYYCLGSKGMMEKYFPYRTRISISSKAKKLGIKNGMYWSNEEISIITDCANKEMTFKEIHQVLPNRTEIAIESKLRELGYTFNIDFWTEEEIQFLKLKYPIPYITTQSIADALGRSCASVNSKVYKMGIRREVYKDIDGVKHRMCATCKTYKPVEENFDKRNERNEGKDYTSICKRCKSNYERKRKREINL